MSLREILDDILSDAKDRIRLVIERHEEEAVAAERALADALAEVLDSLFDAQGRHILEEDTPVAEVVAVLARYREARA